MQQFWDQVSKFKVEMGDQAGENILRYDPDVEGLPRSKDRVRVLVAIPAYFESSSCRLQHRLKRLHYFRNFYPFIHYEK